MSRAKSSKSTATTPGWIDDILKAIDEVTVPRSKPFVTARTNNTGIFSPIGHKVTASVNFGISALGLSFSVINAIYLASMDRDCSGYNKQERQFLFATSIILAAFFGLLTISSLYGLGNAFS